MVVYSIVRRIYLFNTIYVSKYHRALARWYHYLLWWSLLWNFALLFCGHFTDNPRVLHFDTWHWDWKMVDLYAIGTFRLRSCSPINDIDVNCAQDSKDKRTFTTNINLRKDEWMSKLMLPNIFGGLHSNSDGKLYVRHINVSAVRVHSSLRLIFTNSRIESDRVRLSKFLIDH